VNEVFKRALYAIMNVTARRPAQSDDLPEYPVLALDPDFDDLPTDHTEGTEDDEITQEAVIRLVRAVLIAVREPSEAMIKAAWASALGEDAHDVWQDMIDELLR
jgi:hypothetical protein